MTLIRGNQLLNTSLTNKKYRKQKNIRNSQKEKVPHKKPPKNIE